MKFKYTNTNYNNNSAQEVLSFLVKTFAPKSLLDVGCGIGNWGMVAKELGIPHIKGIDFSEIVANELKIDPQEFEKVDLRKPFKLNEEFDLVISLEVGEHLPIESAEDFVHSICQHGDIVLFSAAIPGQGGFRHINEQWPDYWALFFHKQGFQTYDVLRNKFWNNTQIKPWYKQNMLLFAKPSAVAQLNWAPTPQVSRLVHPDIFLDKVKKLHTYKRNPSLQIGYMTFLRAIARYVGYKGKS